MADDEDYEIIPHKEIANLKKEIKALKDGELGDSEGGLKSKIDQMFNLFKEANLMIKNDRPVSEQMRGLKQELERISDQNQRIAEAVLAIVDLVKGTPQETKETAPKGYEPSMGNIPVPPGSQGYQMPSKTPMPPPGPNNNMAFPPPRMMGMPPMPPSHAQSPSNNKKNDLLSQTPPFPRPGSLILTLCRVGL